MATTYQKLAEQIRTTFYGGVSSDDAQFSLRHIAEMIASEIAVEARKDAFENSNLGETTYSNDQFTSVFKNVAIINSGDEKYSMLPATPTGLPNNQEIVSVRITGNNCGDCIPMRGKDNFAQDLLGYPLSFVFYKIEDGKIIYVTKNPLIEGTSTIKMIGAIPSTGSILDAVLNIPKSSEIGIIDRVIARLTQTRRLPQDTLNDATDKPTP